MFWEQGLPSVGSKKTRSLKRGRSMAVSPPNSWILSLPPELVKFYLEYCSMYDCAFLYCTCTQFRERMLVPLIGKRWWSVCTLCTFTPTGPTSNPHHEYGPMPDTNHHKDVRLLRTHILPLNTNFTGLTDIKICDWHDHPLLSPNILPDSVLHLSLGYGFQQVLEENQLPKNLLRLQFGDSFNCPLTANVLPKTLIYLDLGQSFNMTMMPGVLPPSLAHLIFGNNFNQPLVVGVLPASLSSLTFGDDFNQPLENVLPTGLKSLSFGDHFNQPLLVLPDGLRVTLGKEFNNTFGQPRQ